MLALVARPVAVVLALVCVMAGALTGDHPSTLAAGVRDQVGVLPNPGRIGPHATERLVVFRGWERVEVDMPLRVEDLVEVTYPTSAAGGIAEGMFPVVMLLHGRHQWCSTTGGEVPDPVPGWCNAPPGTIPVPSFQGYRYVADRLASQGRIVVSLSANGINAQDGRERDLGATARALLIEYHLHRLARAGTRTVEGYGDLLVGHVDLSRTILMGHSRGGEGVVRAAQMFSDEAAEPFRIAGVIPLAPVSFARMAPPTVPTVTVLPACDGDVSDLQGQTYQDRGRDLYGTRGALRSSVWVPGANHNYFNTEWTPGLSASDTGSDDADYDYEDATGTCAKDVRLSPEQERLVGIDVMAAAVRYAQDTDVTMQPVLDGTGTQPRALAQAGIVIRATSLAGPDRLLVVPRASSAVTASGATAVLCRGIALASSTDQGEVCGTGVATASGDTMWLGSAFVAGGDLPGRTAMDFSWTGDGRALVALRQPVDLTRTTRLSARVSLDPSSVGSVGIVVRDADGRTASAPSAGLPIVPLTRGEAELRLWAQTAWIDPRGLRGVDLSRIVAVGVTTQGSGRAWLIDMSHRGPRPAGPASVLPVAEVPTDTVVTVDAGSSITVPVSIMLDRPAAERVRLQVAATSAFDDSMLPGWNGVVSVAPGMRRATARIPVTMPEAVGPGAAASVQVAVYALSGATVGMFRGTLTVLPRGVRIRTVQIPVPNVVAGPGQSLTWTFAADEPGKVRIIAGVIGATMDLSDIDPEWLASLGLPTSGPITPETPFRLSTRQVADDRYEMSLPLSTTARAGASIEFQVTSVQGAAAKDLPSLTGLVSAGN